jgi:hypothetical protein
MPVMPAQSRIRVMTQFWLAVPTEEESMRVVISTLAMIVLIGAATAGQNSSSTGSGGDSPLFASVAPIELTLKAPLKTLFDNRDDDAPQQPATIEYRDEAGNPVTRDLMVELRGHNRRLKRVCNFPPIRLDFPKKEMEGTLFEGQNRIKLVTHCQDKRDEYQQYVLLEYLIYRAYNVLTDLSFQVRLANITYEDTEGSREPITKIAFLIEDDDALAKRNGWEVLEVPAVSPLALDEAQLNLVEVFQYMVGHTDFSAFMSQAGEDKCCHNGRLIGKTTGPVYPVPYDFDFAGLINARYAVAAEQLGLRNVRQRKYRGVCHEDQVLHETLQRFNDNKTAIYGLFQSQSGLDERQVKQATDYLDDFYEIINDDGKIRREFVRECRQAA